ncbi:GGDEF domain-containing protein [Psychrobium sp. nBUS_13]|uniref:GGDEF domain-containing protein n=1 Tax=Psychrobium sp. nBUS_13 TaxID=3395319 RepID=UPI003EBC4886
MKDNSNFDESVKTLKKTIPLMMKYSVPVNPTNYALWYTYASNEVPNLNRELDSTLKLYNTCPKFHAEQLYTKHVKNEAVDQAKTLQASIDKIMSKVGDSIGNTQNNAKSFEQEMSLCHEELAELDSIETPITPEAVSGFVGELLSKSMVMRDNAKSLGDSLESAQREIKSLRMKLADSQQDALYDALTGLLNRRAFEQEIDGLLALPDAHACLIIADIDNFKAFNDKHGHTMGDQVLKAVGKRLAISTSNGAFAFRYGGEEFAVLLPKSTITRAHVMAEKIRLSIERLIIKDRQSGEKIANITCSFGVANLLKDKEAIESINLADQRLYKAKQQGRNKVISLG